MFPTPDRVTGMVRRWYGRLLLPLFLAPLVLIGYTGGFSRFIADDFCTLGSLRMMGLLESQLHWYQTWSGRFSFTLLANILELAGPSIARALPGLVLALWVFCAGLATYRLGQRCNVGLDRADSFTIGAMLVFTIAAALGNPFQSLYWFTGILTYSVPLILLTAYAGWLLRQSSQHPAQGRAPWILLLGFVVPLLAGGFSETFVAVQTAILAAAAILPGFIAGRSWFGRREFRLLASGLSGSLLALAIVALSPGNAVRQDLLEASPGLLQVLRRSLADLRIFSSIMLHYELPLLMLAAGIPALIVLTTAPAASETVDGLRKRLVISVLGLPLLTAGLILVSFIPYEYALSSYPDDRVLITPIWLLLSGISLWSVAAALLLRELRVSARLPVARAASILAAGSLVLTALFAAGQVRVLIRDLPEMQAFAKAWDARHANLLRAVEDREVDVRAASLRHMGGLAEIESDPNVWINRCLAQAYGIDRVRAK